MYVGLNGGWLRVCDADNLRCEESKVGSTSSAAITSLTFVRRPNQDNTQQINSLYAGLENGKIYECTVNKDSGVISASDCTALKKNTLTTKITSIKYLTRKNLKNNDIVYKLYAGSSDGRLLNCTLNNATPSCVILNRVNASPIVALSSGADYLPVLFTSRGNGEIPLRKAFNFVDNSNVDSLFSVRASKGKILHQMPVCDNANCNPPFVSSILELYKPIVSSTSSDGLEMRNIIKNECYDATGTLLAEPIDILYVITAGGDLKLVQACTNKNVSSNTKRYLQMFDAAGDFITAKTNNDQWFPNEYIPIAVVHATIDGDYGNTYENSIKSQVYSAGEVQIDNLSRLVRFNNCSGHFKPSLANLYYAYQYFKNKGYINSTVPFQPQQVTNGHCQYIDVQPTATDS